MRPRNWFFGLAVLLVPLTVSAQTLPMPAAPAAVVNGEPIPMVEVRKILDSLSPPVVPPTAEQKRDMQKNVTDMLVDDLIMRQYLRRTTAPPSAAAVDKALAELKDTLAKKKTTLAEFLKEGNQTEAQLRQDLSAQLQWKAYVAAHTNDDMLRAYYSTNKLFFDKVTVRASHILIKVNPGAPDAEKQAARTKLQAIRQEIATGKIDFTEAARRYSDCPSKQDGGDLGGYFQYKFDVVEPFARAAFSLKVGELSDLVETENGYHLIKVQDRKNGEPSTFERLKEQIREVYGMELSQQVMTEQKKVAQVQINLQ